MIFVLCLGFAMQVARLWWNAADVPNAKITLSLKKDSACPTLETLLADTQVYTLIDKDTKCCPIRSLA